MLLKNNWAKEEIRREIKNDLKTNKLEIQHSKTYRDAAKKKKKNQL